MMRSKHGFVLLCLIPGAPINAQTKNDPSKYNVTWTTPGEDSFGTMPLGNAVV